MTLDSTLLDILLAIWLTWYLANEWLLPKLVLRNRIKQLRKELMRRYHYDRDLFKEETNNFLLESIEKSENLIKDKDLSLSEKKKTYTKIGDEFIKRFPKSQTRSLRNALEAILVIGVLIFSFRSLAYENFIIPTGSMQPTLYGVTVNDASDNYDGYERSPEVQPQGLRRFLDKLYYGKAYYNDIDLTEGHFYGPYQLSVKELLQKGYFPVLYDICKIIKDNKTYYFPGKVKHFADALQDKEAVAYSNQVDLYTLSQIRKVMTPEQHRAMEHSHQQGRAYLLPYVFKNARLKGHTRSGDALAVNRWSYAFSDPKRGDITVFTTEKLPPLDGHNHAGLIYVKRLIGMPGDILRIHNNSRITVKEKGSDHFVKLDTLIPKACKKLYSDQAGYHGHTQTLEPTTQDKIKKNLTQLDYDYQVDFKQNYTEYKIPDNFYFMLGDNSNNSRDSRYFGPVPRQSLRGTPSFVFWPFTNFGPTDNNQYHKLTTRQDGEF